MDLQTVNFSISMALAIVATLGYVLGRRTQTAGESIAAQSRRELRRAQAVARELEKIALTVRKNLAKHSSSISRFKQRVGQLGGQQHDDAWQDLCSEAEEILKPTLQLATQIATAYDQIRQQTNHLMTFTESRTDPLTGVSNRRGLDAMLESQFAMMVRYETVFSLVLFDIDHFKAVNDKQGHLCGDQILQHVAALLDEKARETDLVARYGGEEFVVVMPQTGLEGAGVFAERVRQTVEEQLPVTVSGGVATAQDGDTPDSLMARADSALYGAKSAGRNCLFRHTGDHIESAVETPPVVVM